jgi:UDP-N-acetylglucosamine--N-acetylmuramyl-(pentapeptide) pyrophosphoryl-undecaprenol N-acetylglucosamine transferase
MKVVVACGGTGGHTFPGIAVSEALRKRGHEVVVWGSGRDVESHIVKLWTGEFFSTGARQLTLRNAFAVFRSIVKCTRQLKKNPCDVLIAMGSYSSLPPVIAAKRCSIPVVLHEANTIPGKAVDFLSRFAEKVAISFEETRMYLPNCECVKTGLPIRKEIAQGTRFPFIPSGAFVIYITGGSQGAHAVNELSSKAMEFVKRELDSRKGDVKPVYVIHQTGANDEAGILMTYSKIGIPARVKAFEDKMADAFASADFVIARSGASTCFELAACAKPSLLIPLPTSMRNHQHHNALAFAEVKAADVGIQDKLTPIQLARYILSIYDNTEKLSQMKAAAKSLSICDAADKVVDVVEGIINKSR